MATQLRPFLSEIANAIRSKKGTSGVINAQNFASEIASIPTGSGENPLQILINNKGGDGVPNANYLFASSKCSSEILNEIIATLDFSQCTDFSSMFSNCSRITTIPTVNYNNGTNFTSIFQSCSNISYNVVCNFDKGTHFERAFHSCSSIQSIKIIAPLLYQSNYMFQYCSGLKTIDITSIGTYCGYFATGCYSLTKLIIRTMDTIPTFSSMFGSCYHFTGTVNATYNPDGLKDGRIYVPDAQVDNLKAATGWADFADIIVPLSTLVE